MANSKCRINAFFDNAHHQSVGNADWTIQGAYSDWAKLLKKNGFIIKEITKRITKEVIHNADVLILPEPNIPYTSEEKKAIFKWVKRGGGLFLISDHAGADRDMMDGIQFIS